MKNRKMLLKPSLRIYVLLLVAAIGAMIALYRCSHGKGGMLPIAQGENDTIDIALEYSPFSLYMYGDTLGGFNYELLKLIGQYKGLKMEMHPMVNLGESLSLLDEGVYDIVVAQVPATVDFKRRYLFTDSIYLDRQVLVQLKDSLGKKSVESQLDIAGKTVYVVDGSPAISRIENLSRELGDTIGVVRESRYGQEQLFLMVASGEIKFAVISYKVASSMSAGYPDVDISTDVSFNQLQSWVLRKHSTALRDSLDVWLKELRQTPAYKEIYNRYFE